MSDYNLKYLFHVLFRDGTHTAQNLEDRSLVQPHIEHAATKENPIGGCSSFCDVVIRLDDVDIFSLVNRERINDTHDVYSVHLNDGHFEINGVPFWLHDKTRLFRELQLIYSRQVDRHLNVTTKNKERKFTPAGTDVVYIIGWKGVDISTKKTHTYFISVT